MKQSGLIVTSALSVALTCAALGYCGWFSARGAHSSMTRATDPSSNPALARWRHGQPSRANEALPR
jgi:hypothetical protein